MGKIGLHRCIVSIFVIVVSVCNANDADLDDLISRSSIVARVVLLEGKVNSAGLVGCGFFYGARVVESFKGATKGNFIQFRAQASLLIGMHYLVFIDSTTMPSGSIDQKIADLVIFNQKAENCSEDTTKNTVTEFDSDTRGDAIFELRTVTEIAETGQREFLVGSGLVVGLLDPGPPYSSEAETHIFTEHRPMPVIRGAVLAEDFFEILRESDADRQ